MLNYDLAIVLPESSNDAKSVALLAAALGLLSSALTFGLILVFEDQIISLLNLDVISGYLYLIPLFILFGSFDKVAEQWLARTSQFAKKAKVNVAQSILVNSSKAGLGFFYPYGKVLVFIATAGQMTKLLMYTYGTSLWKIKSYTVFREANWTKLKQVKSVALRYKDFPIYRAPQALIGSLTKQLPVIVLTSIFGPVYGGLYTISQSVLNKPAGVVTSAIGSVFYPRISKAYNTGENIFKMLAQTTLAMLLIAVVPFSLIIFLGPQLFGFVFGYEWINAGEYARWLSFWLLFEFLKVCSVKLLPVLNLQGHFLVYTIVSSCTSLLFLYLGAVVFENDIMAIAMFSISNSVFILGLIGFVLYKSFSYEKSKSRNSK